MIEVLAAMATLLSAGESAPTYADNVAAIVHTKCAGCHRPGQSGPFPLLTFEDVDEHAETIAAVIEDDYMPPWPPTAKSLPFRHDRRLTADERSTLLSWVKAGAPSGDLANAPKPPAFTDGWTLGTPDLVLTMDEAYPVPADGRDIYRWFSLPVDTDEDLYIKAYEFKATSNGVVHHSLLYADPQKEGRTKTSRDGKPGFRGMRLGPENLLGGFVPGTIPTKWVDDLAMVLPAGSDIVLQTHFHPNGRADEEKSSVGLYLVKKKPSRKLQTIQIPPGFGRAAKIDIPPGVNDYTVVDSFTVPVNATAYGVSGHAHYICHTIQLVATYPDGREQVLFDIDDWDLDWQGDYHFAKPVQLPAGTVLRTTLTYDNTEANLDNPYSPPKRVRWGEESTDEMGSTDLVVIADRLQDERRLALAIRRNRLKVLKPGSTVDPAEPPSLKERAIFAKLDANRDGSLQRNEVPAAFQKLFAVIDIDENGNVTPQELLPVRRLLR